MSVRIKTGDIVTIIAGSKKGQTGKVTKVLPAENKVFIEGFGARTRHMRASAYRQAGKKEIQVGIDMSNVALVIDEKAGKTSRVGYAKDKDGKTIRIARQANNKEIK